VQLAFNFFSKRDFGSDFTHHYSEIKIFQNQIIIVMQQKYGKKGI